MLSYISPQAYHDVKLDGYKGNFLAVVGRGESDQALMESLKKFYKNDTNFKIQLVPIPLSGRPSKSNYSEYLREFYRSDHYNFWENSVSFPAVMVTDTSNFRAKMDKCYHKRCDGMRLIDRNDLEFLKRNTDAVIGATLELSEIGRLMSFQKREHIESRVINFNQETSTKTTDVQLDESEIDEEPLMNEPLKCYFGDEWNEIVPTSNSKTVSYEILTALVTLIHCVIIVRQI
ncbi:Hypothetical predicted protein [Paramuricea clavata]|uniref:Uncharacterized protein n=1 Tax=Paramuricea clavata TaxID=317549 RepID=A0A6S7H012_PARCT|nr:Hypothetical predicted protein [Paramuricea clavata]